MRKILIICMFFVFSQNSLATNLPSDQFQNVLDEKGESAESKAIRMANEILDREYREPKRRKEQERIARIAREQENIERETEKVMKEAEAWSLMTDTERERVMDKMEAERVAKKKEQLSRNELCKQKKTQIQQVQKNLDVRQVPKQVITQQYLTAAPLDGKVKSPAMQMNDKLGTSVASNFEDCNQLFLELETIDDRVGGENTKPEELGQLKFELCKLRIEDAYYFCSGYYYDKKSYDKYFNDELECCENKVKALFDKGEFTQEQRDVLLKQISVERTNRDDSFSKILKQYQEKEKEKEVFEKRKEAVQKKK